MLVNFWNRNKFEIAMVILALNTLNRGDSFPSSIIPFVHFVSIACIICNIINIIRHETDYRGD